MYVDVTTLRFERNLMSALKLDVLQLGLERGEPLSVAALLRELARKHLAERSKTQT